jgi:undecaprenyl-diphosphatase
MLIWLAMLLLALFFVHLGSEVVEGETLSFDMRLLRNAQTLRAHYPWVAEVMRDLSGAGSMIVLTFLTVTAVGYLVLVRARATALLLATSVLSGSILVSLLKEAFGRPRPEAAFAQLVAQGLSYPSGHTSMSALVFLTLGTLIAGTRSRLAERIYILAVAVLLTLLVGVSRVVLGVHWATDVLGGWAIGTAWAIAWLLLAHWSARRSFPSMHRQE